MARRPAFIVTPIIIAIGIALFIALITLILNIFLYTFADDVADQITRMPRMYQYDYVEPVVLLCAAQESESTCRQICNDRNSSANTTLATGWTFQPAGDKFLCRGPTNMALNTDGLYEHNRAVVQTRTGNDTLSNSGFGSIGAHIQSAWVYPTRAAPDPIQETIAELASRNESSPSRLPFYYMMVGIGFVILAVNVMIAIVYWMFEDTPLVRQKQSVEIIRGVLTVAAFSLIMPIVWDPAAVFIENAAIFIMSPNGMHAGDVTAQVVLEAGAVKWPEFKIEDILNQIVFHPGGVWGGIQDTITGAVQEVFINIILGFARAQATVLTLISIFITSIVRVEVTMLVVMMYPIAAALALNPLFKSNKLYEEVKTHLIGGLLAPIVGAIIFVTGYATIEAQYATGVQALERWITSLTILIMASTIPVASMGYVGTAAEKATGIISEGFKTSMSVAAPVLGAAGGMMSSMGGGGMVKAIGSMGSSMAGGAMGGLAGGAMGGGGGGGGGGGSMQNQDVTPEDALSLGSRTVEQPKGEQDAEQPRGGTTASNESGDTQDNESTEGGEEANETPKTNWGNFVSGFGSGAAMMPGMMGGSNGLFGGNSPMSDGMEPIQEAVQHGKAEHTRLQDEARHVTEPVNTDTTQEQPGSSGDASGDLRNDMDSNTDSQPKASLRPAGVI